MRKKETAIGKTLSKILKEKGIVKSAIQETNGLSFAQHLYKLETGAIEDPKLSTIEKIADALVVKLSYFIEVYESFKKEQENEEK